MTQNEAIKTIREALEYMNRIYKAYDMSIVYKALAALDQLEQEPTMYEASTTPTSPVHVIAIEEKVNVWYL
jgi:hypothetical protein